MTVTRPGCVTERARQGRAAHRGSRPFTTARPSTAAGTPAARSSRGPGTPAAAHGPARHVAQAQPLHALQKALRDACLGSCSLAASVLILCSSAEARLDPVNKPELLPPGEVTTVIDVAGFLTDGEEKRLQSQIANLEADTGVKLRVLAQNYPQTPGLAVKDYWKVDDSTVVFVADPNFGDILNFNVGQTVDLLVPRTFWFRLAGKYGNKFYWQEKGEEAAIVNAVSAINTCVREPPGRLQCSSIQGELGEKASSGPFGKFFGT